MGIRKTVTWGNGLTAEYHAIADFALDAKSGDCVVTVASYPSELDAAYRSNIMCTNAFSCDFITQAADVYDQIYASLITQPPFIGADTFGLVDVSGQNPRSKPPRPSANHTWDSASETWIITAQQLVIVRSVARERINAAWKEAESEGFTAYGKVFDSDTRAVQRIMGAAQAALVAKSAGQPLNINWTCKDNTTLAMDADMLAQIPIFIAQAGAALHAKCQALKAMVEAATTIEEIEAITWATL